MQEKVTTRQEAEQSRNVYVFVLQILETVLKRQMHDRSAKPLLLLIPCGQDSEQHRVT